MPYTTEKIYTLHEKLREVAAAFPTQIAVQSREGNAISHRLTYQEFYQLAEKVARLLLSCGTQCDDKVAIILENRVEWGAIYFGILLSGAIAVPLDVQANIDDLAFFCEDAECKIAFVARNMAEKIGALPLSQLNKIIVLDSSPNDEKNITGKIISFANAINLPQKSTTQPFPFPQRSPNDIASILYTSGTTGKYKGVMLTHHNFYANYLSIIKIGIPLHHHHFLSLLPLHHSFPFMATLIVPLFTQGKITYLNSLKSDELLQCLAEDEITILTGVPQLFYMLQKPIAAKIKNLPFFIRLPLAWLREVAWLFHKASNINLSKILFIKIHNIFGKKLKYLLSGGAKLDDSVALFFLKLGFNLVEGYGLTETSPVVTFNFDKVHHLTSAGKAISDVNIKILIAENQNAKDIGEVLVQGANVMLGYYKHDDATKEAIKNGWFYTGDLGYLAKDHYLYITGRQKEIIVLSSGKNISPEELELHYGKSPFIKEICITLGGTKTKEKLMAIVVPNIEYCKQIGKVDIYSTLKEELDLLSKTLPLYQRIMGFIVTKEPLPLTRLGKLRRFLIQEKYAKELKGETTATIYKAKEDVYADANDLLILARPLTQQIFALLSKTLAQEKQEKIIHLDDHLELDLGFESLARVELMVAIEKTFNLKIPDAEFSKIATVRELLTLLETIKPSSTLLPREQQQIATWKNLLALDLADELKNEIALEFNAKQKIGFAIGSVLLKCLMSLGWRLKIHGKENLPQNRNFILCPNHISFLDGMIVEAALPNEIAKKTFFIGLTDFFAKTFLRKFTKILKVIPIDPGAQLIIAMQACAYVLRHNKAICIFPEGARSVDGKIKEFKKGIGILAAEFDIPLIPVYIHGAYEAWPRSARFPKPHKVSITFGKPYNAKELQNIGKKLGIEDNYAAIASGIREKVIELEQLELKPKSPITQQ